MVSVDPKHYEEPNDDASLALFPEELRVERVAAIPARVCRPLGFGDISLRAQWTMRRKVQELASRGEANLIFVTVLPGYASLVGAWAKRKFGLPFVLDYQDPWVSNSGGQHPRFSKAGLAHWIATKLEPGVVSLADAFTAVSDETLASLRTRRLIAPGTPIEIIPIGADANDHEVAARVGKSRIEGRAGSPPSAHGAHGVPRPTGVVHLAYVGTLTERMLPALRALMLAVKALNSSGQENHGSRGGSHHQIPIRVHLIGTSAQPD